MIDSPWREGIETIGGFVIGDGDASMLVHANNYNVTIIIPRGVSMILDD
jgi:hypothetical protein